ncbi:MAG: alanine--tRNA ligase-related protein, partial [Cytophagales bacterium]
PCSEIHIDLRPIDEVKKKPGNELVNNDHPQVVEIWNLVFMEFERSWKAGGSNALMQFDLSLTNTDKKAREKLRSASTTLKPLPAKNVDTGMGFERLCMAIQGKTSNYDTDVFTPLMDFIALHAHNYKYGSDTRKDIAVRVMADHIRAVSFAISDGQLPSNTGAGYVIRRILRRAVRYGFSYLNIKEPFIHRLVPLLALQLKDVFPELHQQLEYVTKVVHEEEISFLRTLEKGIKRFEEVLPLKDEVIDTQKLVVASSKDEMIEAMNTTDIKFKISETGVIPGFFAFELYDTFGFPFDLTSLIARERGLKVNEKGFNEEMAKQKTRSKADAAKETGDWVVVSDGEKPEFIGYESWSSSSKILRYRKVKQKNKELFQLVLDKTPFYAESGGQVGDTGILEIGTEKIHVIDTKKENDLIVHWVEKLPTNLGGNVNAVIDSHKRKLSM